jgi:hypothetical protein
MREAAAWLGATVHQVTLLVPAGDVTLSVWPGYRFTETMKERSSGDPPIAQTTLKVKGGERRVVELRPSR